MFIVPILLASAAAIGWKVVPWPKAMLATVMLGFGLSTMLAISWSLWNEPVSEILWWLAWTFVYTGSMVVVTAVSAWIRASRQASSA